MPLPSRDEQTGPIGEAALEEPEAIASPSDPAVPGQDGEDAAASVVPAVGLPTRVGPAAARAAGPMSIGLATPSSAPAVESPSR